MRRAFSFITFAGCGWMLVACSSGQVPAGSAIAGSSAGGSVASTGGSAGTLPNTGGSAPVAGTGGGIVLEVGGMDASSGGATESGGSTSKVVMTLPDGFTATETGGFELGPAIGGQGGSSSGGGGSAGAGGAAPNGNCGNILLGVVRDFKGADEAGGHPDFEAKIAGSDVTPGLVQPSLGPDQTPVYASKCEIGDPNLDAVACPYGPQTTSSAAFQQWYHNVDGVNAPYLISIFLAPQTGGLFTFESLHYFPVDDAGFKSRGPEYTGESHNFGFTTEIHTQFRYRGGEKFTFQGDDDVWVFVGGKLAVDLGGLHSMKRRTIDLDKDGAGLGLTIGGVYSLDLFHAERHTDASTFRIDTNLTFVDCGKVPPPPPK